METVIEFLNKLASKGVKLSAEAGRLNCYAQKGTLTNDIREGILKHRSQLITMLQGRGSRQELQRCTEFPLSAGEKGLYVLQSLNPEMSAYNVPVCFRINSPIDAEILAKAWDCVVEQFPILTARVIHKDGALYHRLDDDCKTRIQQRTVDFEDDGDFLAFLRKRVKQPFDLNRGPLTRIELFIREKQKPVLLLTVHHMVFDGTSAIIVLRSLLAFYEQLCEGKPVRLSNELPGYQEFVAWEAAMLASGEGAAHAGYWQRQLDGELPAIELLSDWPRLATASHDGKTVVEDVPAELAHSIHQFAKAHSVQPSVMFLAVLQLLLHRYTNHDDITIGMPVMGRAARQFAGEVGYFINMVPLRAHCGGRIKAIDFLRKAQGTMLDAVYHSAYPFPLMLEKFKSRQREKNPIFQVSYAYQNFAKPADFISLLHQQKLQLETVEGIWQEGDFDLGLEIFEGHAASFVVHLKYNPALYAQETIGRLCGHYFALLGKISSDADLLLHEVPLVTEKERQQVLAEYNNTRAGYPASYAKDKCIHLLFGDRVALDSSKIAVACGEQQLTYRQLFERSQALAVYLQSLGVKPDSLVGLCVERSLDMVVGLLGILQAGGAYVPLDPDDPAERLSFILQDSQAAIVLTQENLKYKLSALVPADRQLIALDGPWPKIDGRAALNQEVEPDDRAYVIYTTDAAGKPKGVEVSHRSVVNVLCSIRQEPGIADHDTLLAMTPLTLDRAALEIALPLCSGARLVVAERESGVNGAALLAKLRSSGATMLQATPATWRLLLDAGWKGDPKVTLLCAGEALSRDLANQLLETGCPLWNVYGPTETTSCSAVSRVESGDGVVPLGLPISNTQIYILDRHNHPQPIGVPGEMHIAGDGLARGYLDRPELTREKFVPNPFVPGTRMYKTGDLARWLDGGNIQYLGRLDRQIALRGFRIEPGEIEARLNQHSRIEDSAVIAQGQDAKKQLIAFYRAKDTHADRVVRVPQEELRAHLSRILPEYMVPAAFISLAALPLNSAGKVDHRELERIALKQQLQEHLDYWRIKLNGVPESLDLVTDYPRTSVQGLRAANHPFGLDAQLAGQLQDVAQQKGASLFMTLLAALNVLLYRYTGQGDICVGSPIVTRQGSNVLALRSQVEGDDTFSALLSQVKATCLEAYRHQDAPFETVVEMLPQQSMAIGPICQVMVMAQAVGKESLGRDLTVAFTETAEGLAGSILYSPGLHRPQTIERMAAHFVALCRAVIATPTAKIRDLDYIGESERHQVLVEYNDTGVEYPKDKCIDQLFVERAAIHSERIAVVCGDAQLTYRQLQERSRNLALYLQSMGVQPESVVGLCAERSLEMMVGIMGTVQAGGAYLQTDPAWPDDRLAYILQDSQAAVVLTQERFRNRIGSLLAPNAKLITLDKQWSEISKYVAGLRAKNVELQQDVKPHNLSHVVYAAGSSGKPKGVLCEHKSLVNRIHWMQRRYPLNPNDVVLSVSDWFWPLMAGATVVWAAPDRHGDVHYLESLINTAKVTILRCVPSMLEAFGDEARGRCGGVKEIFCSGALDRQSVERCKVTFPNAALHLLYAPAETAIEATAYDCSRLGHPFVPIGTPIDNTQIYILDRQNQPQPIGVPGELHIAGDGLARGYLNRPKVTQERFVTNPFMPGSRMYKTGDLARWLDDGNIQYLGQK